MGVYTSASWKKHHDLLFNKILVPTIDTLKNSFILKVIYEDNLNALLVGYS
jgi:hypothetical protein